MSSKSGQNMDYASDFEAYLAYRSANEIQTKELAKAEALKKLMDENARKTFAFKFCPTCKTRRPTRHFQKVGRSYFNKQCIFCEVYR